MIFKYLSKPLIVLSLLISFFAFYPQAFAADSSDWQKKLEDNKKEQERVRNLLEETRSKKSSLQNEITYQDNQIKLTELKIQETENQIESLTGQINKLEGVLTNLSDIFAQRAAETYVLTRTGGSLVTLLTSDSVSEFISRFEYLQRIQENDRELLLQMQTTQTNFEDQRTLVEALHDKLESQNETLARQKAQKQKLLEVTKNDEKNYQQLLASLRADEDSINRALAALGEKIGPVKKGDIIGAVGNTGCSTGPHLHYGVYENAKVQNSSSGVSYVVGDRVNPHKYLDNGQLSHPLPGANVNTEYGEIYYILTSGGSSHTGIDYGYGFGNTAGKPIYASGDGIAYRAQDSKSCSLTGTVGKGIIIDHQNGLVTLYWHLP